MVINDLELVNPHPTQDALWLKEKILQLKKERKALIVAHNYQLAEVHEVADRAGDSLELSRIAAQVEAELVVFCGVHFMAESAAILSPEKTILLPEKEAGCPMADMVTAEQLGQFKRKYPQAMVVCYVNTSAEVKAESDICCTSANAIKVVNSLTAEQIIFVPDKNLAKWVEKHTDKEIIPWEGYCSVHHFLELEEVLKAKEELPEALVLAHPECRLEILEIADKVLSTSGMLEYASKSPAKEFIICTELGLLYQLQQANPSKKFWVPSEFLVCPNMKITKLDSVFRALEENLYQITVEKEIAIKAKEALDKMLAIPRDKVI